MSGFSTETNTFFYYFYCYKFISTINLDGQHIIPSKNTNTFPELNITPVSSGNQTKTWNINNLKIPFSYI